MIFLLLLLLSQNPDHHTGEVLAYVLGSRTDEMFLKLKKLLEPFGVTKFYTDGLKTYERHIPVEIRYVSKYIVISINFLMIN